MVHTSYALTRLPGTAPFPHRIAHRLAASSFRGHRYYWALARCLSEWPLAPSVRIGPRHADFPLKLELKDLLDERLYRGTHEQAEMKLAACLVSSGGTCIDIGANIGLYTLLLAALVGPRGRVIAFEPSPATRYRLETVCAGVPGVTILPFALGSEDSVLRLAQSEGTHGWSTLRSLNTEAATFSDVSVRRLDEVDEVKGSDPIDFLKLDVEGWESEVVNGSIELLSSGRICSAIVEVTPKWGHTEYVDHLAGLRGYHGFVIAPRKSASHFRLVPALVPYKSSLESQFQFLLIRDDRLSLVEGFIAE